MRRVALILAVVGAFCVAASQAQAHGWDRHPGYDYHRSYYGRVVPVPPPAVVVARPVVVAPPPCHRRYYAPATSGFGFYFSGRNVSVGVGF